VAGPGFPASVTIYGTGLIGCSLALALRKANAGVRIFGVDRPEILQTARAIGAIDAINNAPPERSDLVILCTPVGEILSLLATLSADASIILDVGSTKVDICKKAEDHRLPFVGGHPMTGLERSGPEAASAELFNGARFFLCPVSSSPADAIARLDPVIRAMGAIPQVISPHDHDKLVAELSHLPQILSTVLADQTGEHRDFAGPGWKSVTRLAASPFHVWRDILATSGSLPDELKIYIERLHDILDALERKDLDRLEIIFERANRNFK
jgi:prephenate dehydrogenase